jgi:autotransporter-associated beta strand protein
MTRLPCRIAATILWLAASGSAPAQNTFTVTSTSDTNWFGLGLGYGSTGDLRYCIHQANALSLSGQTVTINFNLPANSTIALKRNILPPLNPGAAGQLGANNNSLLIDGSTSSGVTIDGGSSGFGIFMAYSGKITIQNLTLANGLARGGAGGGGGGGGMGAGGGILVNNLASVTAASVTFNNTRSQGGAGGTGPYASGSGGGTNGGDGGADLSGGGGLGGRGGGTTGSYPPGGGGGGGVGAAGGGSSGQFTNGAAGAPSSDGGPGGSYGGGGGALAGVGGGGGVGAISGGGGFGGGSGGGTGGSGGDYGGGGGGGGGTGGYGGGGGDHGAGGFGGGGGGGITVAGSGGFGGGSGSNPFGGGGLGAGGAALVRAGGSLTMIDPVFAGSITAVGGTFGGPGSAAGQAIGQGLFLGGNVTIQVSGDNSITLPGTDFVGGGTDPQAQGGLIKSGPGTLVLGGSNSYSGGTTISGGTVRGSAAGFSTGAITDNAILDFDQPTTATLSQTITGTGSLTKLGVGALTLAGTNFYSGGTTISAGTLQFGAGGIGSGPIMDNDTLAFSGGLSTVSAPISGSGAVTVIAGQLTLGGNNSYSGPTVVSGGTLVAGSSTAFGTNSAVTVASGAYLNLGGMNVAIGSLSGSGTVNNDSASTPATLTVGSNNTSTTFSSIIADGSGPPLALVKMGTGTLALTGSCFYSGGTTITAGTIQFGSGGLGSGPVVDNATLVYSSTGPLAFSNAVAGSGGLFVLGGTLTLNGANSYSGPTQVLSGTVVASNSAALGTNSAVSVAGGSALSLLGTNTAIGSLAGAGTVNYNASAPGTLTVGSDNSSQTFSGVLSDANGFPLTLVKVGSGTQTFSGRVSLMGGYTAGGGTLEFSGTRLQPGPSSLTAGAGASIMYDSGAIVSGGYLRGPGTHVVTGGATLTGVTSFNSAVINQTGPSTLQNFTNGGPLNVAAGLAAPVLFDGFTNQGSGSITVGAGSQAKAADFQTYGAMTLNNGSTAVPTQLTNTGPSPLYFNGGSRTFISIPAHANPNQFDAGIDLAGQNAVVAGGLLVNNGYVVDSIGSHFIIADFGSLVKGAGFYQISPQTVNGGKFQSGNSPGRASFGSFTFGPGGVTNYVFAIDDATGAAGPSPDVNGFVSGWGLVSAIRRLVGSATTPGDFAWTADAIHPLTVHVDTLVNPTTVGTDVVGPMADFDPTKPYAWPAVQWTGSYSGPADAAAMNAATAFDTTGFANPIAGTFGWSLDAGAHSLSLTYTPSAVPEPGVFELVAAGLLAVWRGYRRWCQ